MTDYTNKAVEYQERAASAYRAVQEALSLGLLELAGNWQEIGAADTEAAIWFRDNLEAK